MFDIGFSELLVIAIVALIVLGPERLPKATRFAGLWVRRARAQWHSVKDELERELAADELKRSLKQAQDAVRETEQKIRDSAGEAERQFDEMRESVRNDARALREDVESAVSPPPDAAPDRADDAPGAQEEGPLPSTLEPPPDADEPEAGTTADLFPPQEPRDEPRSP